VGAAGFVILAAILLVSVAALALQVQARGRGAAIERTTESLFGDLPLEVRALRATHERLTERIDRLERALDHRHARIEEMLAHIESRARSRVSADRFEEARIGMGPERTRTEVGAETEVERVVSDGEELLRLCDSTPPEESALRTWAAKKEVAIAFLVGQSTDWYLLRLERAGAAAVVPAMRRPMATVPLGDYYDLISYDGVGPLKAADIKRICVANKVEGRWLVERRGQIAAS
jgi:hypothetical protein